MANKKDATVFNNKEKAKLEARSMETSQRNWFYIRAEENENVFL